MQNKNDNADGKISNHKMHINLNCKVCTLHNMFYINGYLP